jgi:hypothetical protein
VKQGATAEQLRERCLYWQQVLRLQDWRIDVRVVRMKEMEGDDGEERGGCILRWSQDRQATLKILDSIDYPPDCHLEEDQERTLVHELLHLYTQPFDLPDTGPKQLAEEQMINALAGALVQLERR